MRAAWPTVSDRRSAADGSISGVGSYRFGIVVGMRAESRIAQRLDGVVVIGAGAAGASQAAEQLAMAGAAALLSFGLAGGLDPNCRPGTIVVPRAVLDGDERLATDAECTRALGGATADLLLGTACTVAGAEEKRHLHERTGAVAVDLESGAVARVAHRRGLPFAVLRAVCDPAERSLPPAALAALDAGGTIRGFRLFSALLADPRQIAGLLALARDAAAARRALIRHAAALHRPDPISGKSRRRKAPPAGSPTA